MNQHPPAQNNTRDYLPHLKTSRRETKTFRSNAERGVQNGLSADLGNQYQDFKRKDTSCTHDLFYQNQNQIGLGLKHQPQHVTEMALIIIFRFGYLMFLPGRVAPAMRAFWVCVFWGWFPSLCLVSGFSLQELSHTGCIQLRNTITTTAKMLVLGPEETGLCVAPLTGFSQGHPNSH